MNSFVATQTKNHDKVNKTNEVFHWGVKSDRNREH